jgi:8-hydroxy-5-deazaflavin:NADPH oxidoreductase
MEGATVAVVGGTGQQGSGIARRLARGGAAVIVGSRDPARAAATIATWAAPAGAIRSAGYREAIAAAAIVVLTVPFDTLAELLAQHHADFAAGALVVDVTVPVIFGAGTITLADIADGSAAEYVKARLRDDLRVAATFKTVPARLLNEIDQPLQCDEFVCGDSREARDGAMALVRTIDGLRPIDVGPLSRAAAIEHATLLAIAINRRHKIHDARFRVVGL